VSSKTVAGAAGAAVTGAATWLSGTVSGVAVWAFSTEEIWFSLAATYERYLAPEFGALPSLGPVFLGLLLIYGVARLADLRNGGDDDR
jgi:hypothetical protein